MAKKQAAVVCPKGHEAIVGAVHDNCGDPNCERDHQGRGSRTKGLTTYPCAECQRIYLALPYETQLHEIRSCEELGIALVGILRGFAADEAVTWDAQEVREAFAMVVTLGAQGHDLVGARMKEIREANGDFEEHGE